MPVPEPVDVFDPTPEQKGQARCLAAIGLTVEEMGRFFGLTPEAVSFVFQEQIEIGHMMKRLTLKPINLRV